MNFGQRINPFKGLSCYDEKDKDIFFGRDNLSRELFNLVVLNELTLVFGKSGIGKTSLFNAGLFPLLRDAGFLPVRLRLDYSSCATLIDQLKQGLQNELREKDVIERVKGGNEQASSFSDVETLWEYFHRVDHVNWEGKTVIPILVLDQFEEIFTIGKHHPQRDLLIEELNDLVEDQVPFAVKERLLSRSRVFPFLRSQIAVRMVLGLREDYLPHMNVLKPRIPSIHRVMYRVIHLNGIQAREVLDRSGAFSNEGIKQDILRQFEADDPEPDQTVTLEKLEVEPALLSLLCYQVFEQGVESLSIRDKDEILSDFYDRILSQLPQGRELSTWIEDHLVTEGGFRTPFYLERGFGLRETVEVAIDKKLLRKLHIGEKEHVEIIHDVLAPVIKERRNRRIEEKKRVEMAKKLRSILVAFIIASILAIYAFIQKNRADHQYVEAEKQTRRAEEQKNEADSQRSIVEEYARSAIIEKIRADQQCEEAKTQRKNAELMKIKADFQRSKAEENANLANNEKKRADEQYKNALSLRLASESNLVLPTESSKAFRLAEAAYKIGSPNPDAAVIRALCAAAYSIGETSFYNSFINHESNINTAVFSPDGKLILTASSDKNAKVWDIEQNILVTQLKGHKDTVNSAVFSPDGSRILTASNDNSAKLWDLKGNLLVDFKGHTSYVNSAVFSPDGKLILTASSDNTAKLWVIGDNLKIDKKIDITKHKDKIISALFSPNGNFILTASWDHNAKLWNMQGENIWPEKDYIYQNEGNKFDSFNIKIEDMHSAKLTSAVFSPDGSMILTASNDGKAKLWDLQRNCLAELKGHISFIYSAIFSPDGSRILTTSWDKTAGLWDLKGKLLAVLKGHTDKINDAVFSPYGKWILTTSDDKRAIIWASPEIIIEKIKMKNLSIPELTKEDKKKFGIADFEL